MKDESVLCKGSIERIGLKRCGKALENGANIVIELPCVYSLMSAEGFANAGVTQLEKAGIVDEIAFGTECDDINKLKETAKKIDAIGHRIVQGGDRNTKSVLVTEKVVKDVEELAPLAPLHNPAHLMGYRACLEVVGPDVPQVFVFDTSFHSTMPPKAYMYAVPYEYYEKYAVRRYGFHGTSHKFFIISELIIADFNDNIFLSAVDFKTYSLN